MAVTVLLPYKITLLSNNVRRDIEEISVLLPYKITLLSNRRMNITEATLVLLPYKITLLSNVFLMLNGKQYVLLPYKITLLSNRYQVDLQANVVLLPYKITLLSNLKFEKNDTTHPHKLQGFIQLYQIRYNLSTFLYNTSIVIYDHPLLIPGVVVFTIFNTYKSNIS